MNAWSLTAARGVALLALARASTKRARPERLRESCIMDVGEAQSVGLDEKCGLRERVVLVRGEDGSWSLITPRRANASDTDTELWISPPAFS